MADEQLGWILVEIRKQNEQLAEMRKELRDSVEKTAGRGKG